MVTRPGQPLFAVSTNLAAGGATSEKVKKAYERNKKLGKPWGRKKTPWDVATAKELRADGKGWREIAKHVGVSYQTVRRELRKASANNNQTDPAEIERLREKR